MNVRRKRGSSHVAGPTVSSVRIATPAGLLNVRIDAPSRIGATTADATFP